MGCGATRGLGVQSASPPGPGTRPGTNVHQIRTPPPKPPKACLVEAAGHGVDLDAQGGHRPGVDDVTRRDQEADLLGDGRWVGGRVGGWMTSLDINKEANHLGWVFGVGWVCEFAGVFTGWGVGGGVRLGGGLSLWGGSFARGGLAARGGSFGAAKPWAKAAQLPFFRLQGSGTATPPLADCWGVLASSPSWPTHPKTRSNPNIDPVKQPETDWQEGVQLVHVTLPTVWSHAPVAPNKTVRSNTPHPKKQSYQTPPTRLVPRPYSPNSPVNPSGQTPRPPTRLFVGSTRRSSTSSSRSCPGSGSGGG